MPFEALLPWQCHLQLDFSSCQANLLIFKFRYYVILLFPQNSPLNFMDLESKIIQICVFLVEKQFNKDASQKNNIYWSAKVICKWQ